MDNILNEIKKCHIDFLSQLHFFYEDFHNIINGNPNYKLSTNEIEGYIINPKLIEALQNFYYYDQIKNKFKKGKKINEIIKTLQKEYLEIIKRANDDILRKDELFHINITKYGKLDIKYFLNCTIISSDICNILFKDIYIYDKLKHFKINYITTKKKLILIYEIIINIGKLNQNNIFIPEILILCTGNEYLKNILEDIKFCTLDKFFSNINIIEKNIGKYKGNNVVVFLNEQYIPKNNQIQNMILPNNNQQKMQKNNQIKQSIRSNQNINNNSLKSNMKNPNFNINNIKDGSFSNNQDIHTDSSRNVKVKDENQKEKQNMVNIEGSMEMINQFEQQNHKMENQIKSNEINNKNQKELLYKKRIIIEYFIEIMIDLEKTNIKMNLPLNNSSDSGKYYIINLEWLIQYMKYTGMINIYNNNIIKTKIETLVKDVLNRSNSEILNLLKTDKNFNKEIENMYNFVNDNSVIQFQIEPQIYQTKQFYYYYNFILLSDQVINSLSNYIQQITPHGCLFGDKMAFIINKTNKYIQIFEKNEKIYLPKLIFRFHENNYVIQTIKLIKENGFENYKKYYLMFNNDFVSPIFNPNDEEIGYAYLYNSKIQDYSNYIINKKLIAIIKLYFNYAKIHSNNNKGRNGKYILINQELINAYKKYYLYPQIEQELNNNNFVKQIIFKIKGEWNDFHNIINDKKISIIIKNYLMNINQQFIFLPNQVYNINEEPKIEEIKGNSYFYYNNFEIIEEDIYSILFNNNNYTDNANYRECYFENSYMYFSLSEYLCNNKNPRNIEICVLQKDNSFCANFLMECNSTKSFKIFLESSRLNGGFEICLKSFQFNNSTEQLFDNIGNPIGLIYNLVFKTENQNNHINNNNNKPNNNIIINRKNSNNDMNKNPIFNEINRNMRLDNNNSNNISNNISQNNNNNNLNCMNNNINFINNFNNNNIINNFNNNIFNNNFNNNNFNNNFTNINFNNNNVFNNNNFIRNNSFNNNNNFKNNINDNIPLKRIFQKPPLIGLKNVGATCYMNATLQCLSQIERLVIYFKYHQKVEDIIKKYNKKNCLTEPFKVLIENLWPTSGNNHIKKKYLGKNSNNTYFIPEEFKEKISEMNPLFKGVQANDAKDLVNFIIMTLHEELNKYEGNKTIIAKIPNINNNQSNPDFVLQNFLKIFSKENKSIICDLFYGLSHTITNCIQCKIGQHNFEAYFFLNFPLEEVRKYKLQLVINENLMITNQNNMNMNQIFQQNLKKIQLLQNNQVNILDCFEYNQKQESFVGENAMYCNICKKQLPSNYTTYLYSAPPILILVLNRGQGIQFKVKLDFYTELNLSNFIQLRPNNETINYDLIGVVTHMGESGSSGHFIATCKSPIDGLWYQYNDDLVFRVDDFNNQILNYAMPYILFYQKRT